MKTAEQRMKELQKLIGLKACCRIEFLRRLIECPDIQCHLIKISMFCLRFANVSKRIESTR